MNHDIGDGQNDYHGPAITRPRFKSREIVDGAIRGVRSHGLFPFIRHRRRVIIMPDRDQFRPLAYHRRAKPKRGTGQPHRGGGRASGQ